MLFFRTDIVWVLSGQMIALFIGLLSLKVLTNLFDPEQYAVIALMMSFSAWIWSGLYQSLNQTLFRFYTDSIERGWQSLFFEQMKMYQRKLDICSGVFLAIGLIYVAIAKKDTIFYWLIPLSVVMGGVYGRLHGIVSLFLAQRKRKQVTLIQSFDGVFRLIGGLLAFYLFSRSEQITSLGIVIGGVVFLVVVILSSNLEFNNQQNNSHTSSIFKREFDLYFKSSVVILVLHATVIHLDKWLLKSLIDMESLGTYAIIYFLALTIMSIVTFFFETLGIPIILNEKSHSKRKSILDLLIASYLSCVILIVLLSHAFGDDLLRILSNPHVASNSTTFTLLVIACGLINLGKLLMVRGQIDKDPTRYWSSYLCLLIVFLIWCIMRVTPETGIICVSQGLIVATSIFVLITFYINFKHNQIEEIQFGK